jgi:hypothetical protein
MPKSRKLKSPKSLYDRILIFCEGETEQYYFEEYVRTLQLPQNLVSIVIRKSTHTDGRGIVQDLIEHREKDDSLFVDIDTSFAVFDKESIDNRLNNIEAFGLAKTNNVEIAFTSVAFEFWFYLHFEYSTGPSSDYAELKRMYIDCKSSK